MEITKCGTDKQLYPGRTTNCMISMQASSEDSQYASVISILTPMYMDELSAWKDTTPEHRGESYRSFKQEKTEQLLRFIRSHGIDFSDNIEEIHTTTPLSYRDYTGTVDGSAYGIIKDYKCPQIGFVSTRSRLGNSLSHRSKPECARRTGGNADFHAHLCGICRDKNTWLKSRKCIKQSKRYSSTRAAFFCRSL